MEPQDFNKWLVSDLKQILLQYDITDRDIKGSGKNGNVIKKDYVKTISNLFKNEPINNQNINEDIWYNILMHLPYKDLKKACLTDKTAIKVCNHIHFWKDKFEKENLEIVGKMPITIKEWIKKYKIASRASFMASKIVNVLKQDHQYTIGTYLPLDFDMIKIIPQYKDQIEKARRQFVGDFLAAQGFTIKYKNGLEFKFFYQDDNGSTAGKFIEKITLDELYLILYRYLHYFPSKDLIDQNDSSYNLIDLKQELNKLNKNIKTASVIYLENKIQLLK